MADLRAKEGVWSTRRPGRFTQERATILIVLGGTRRRSRGGVGTSRRQHVASRSTGYAVPDFIVSTYDRQKLNFRHISETNKLISLNWQQLLDQGI